MLFVGNVSLEEFADAVLLSSNVSLDDHLLVELFVLAGELASTVDVTQADILVEVAESLAYLSTLALEKWWCARCRDARRHSDRIHNADR